MKFGPTALDEAEGTILAHGVKSGDISLPKATVLSAKDIQQLRMAGISEVVAARLEPDDVGEDQAAQQIAAAMSGAGFEARAASTGRVNLHAIRAGIFTVSSAIIDRVNEIDPSITLATVRNHAPVANGQMVATVKIIPFAVHSALVDKAENAVRDGKSIEVHAYRPRRVALIQTTLSGTRTKVLDKTSRVTEARLDRAGSRIILETRCKHESAALADAISNAATEGDLTIIFGASATSDPDDVIPTAIGLAGGRVIRVGMPVDPGNLITLGELEGKPVIGAPGCARSPKENGFDWVLERILADFEVTSSGIEAMGVGGLLGEIPARPRPRETPNTKDSPKLHAILLAAGQSTRMGGPNKLLARFDGEPLVRQSAISLLESGLALTVVTGFQNDRVVAALAGLDVTFVHNDDFATGLSGSLKTGVGALPANVDGALIALSDMPGIGAADVRRLVDVFGDCGGQSIIRATHAGKRGNPVILPKSVFPMVEQIEGDMGARQIVESGEVPVVDVEIGSAASMDVDTPERLRAAGGSFEPEEI